MAGLFLTRLRYPLGWWVHPRHALSGIGILHVAQAVPDKPADIQFVVQNSCSALGVSVDRAGAPWATERAGNTFAVQVLGDLLRRDARNEVAEDPLDDRRFGYFDLTLARLDVSAAQRLDDSIPIAQAAGGLAVLDSATQSTVCLLRQVLQEEGVHRPLEADVQVGDVAFGKRDDVYAGECQSFEKAGGVFLVAAESVQGLGEDDIESPVEGVPHQRLETRAEKRRAGDGVIRVLVRDRPALPLCKRAADSQLIGGRRIALIVGGVPRVDPDFHDFTSMDRRRRPTPLGLKNLACSLPREHPHERANCVITSRVDRRRRKAASRSRKTSISLASFASSFGHDTPAHVERRFVIRGVRDG